MDMNFKLLVDLHDALVLASEYGEGRYSVHNFIQQNPEFQRVSAYLANTVLAEYGRDKREAAKPAPYERFDPFLGRVKGVPLK